MSTRIHPSLFSLGLIRVHLVSHLLPSPPISSHLLPSPPSSSQLLPAPPLPLLSIPPSSPTSQLPAPLISTPALLVSILQPRLSSPQVQLLHTQVQLIKAELALDASLPTRVVVQEANQLMGFSNDGSLPEQAPTLNSHPTLLPLSSHSHPLLSDSIPLSPHSHLALSPRSARSHPVLTPLSSRSRPTLSSHSQVAKLVEALDIQSSLPNYQHV